MTKKVFHKIYELVVDAGYQSEIDWSENLKPCDNSETFLQEYIWVVLNSGMKNQIARKIYEKVIKALSTGQPIENVFKHKGKVEAINIVILNIKSIFKNYKIIELNGKVDEQLHFLESLPYIGKVTKYHLAKNLGIDICKPDRHLVRLAKQYWMTPQSLCERLSKEIGLRIATIDIILWRAANLGII